MPIDTRDCHCVLCRELTGLDQRSQSTVDTVIEHGWQVIMIPDDEAGPGWAYTIGLWHHHGLPELAMFGLEVRKMHRLLNGLAESVVGGDPPETDQSRLGVIEGYPVVLKNIDYRWYKAYFGTAIGFYRRPPFPMLQAVWPTHAGDLPWQPGGETLINRQPQLWMRPEEHPPGIWTQEL